MRMHVYLCMYMYTRTFIRVSLYMHVLVFAMVGIAVVV